MGADPNQAGSQPVDVSELAEAQFAFGLAGGMNDNSPISSTPRLGSSPLLNGAGCNLEGASLHTKGVGSVAPDSDAHLSIVELIAGHSTDNANKTRTRSGMDRSPGVA